MNLGNKGSEVTVQEKQERAEDIANLLSNNQMWPSHGRMIGVETVKGKFRLKVEDYSTKKHFRENSDHTTTTSLITSTVMTSDHSCITEEISEISEQVSEAVQVSIASRPVQRLEQIQRVRLRIESQEFGSWRTSQFKNH